jgi:hypothetical protein
LSLNDVANATCSPGQSSRSSLLTMRHRCRSYTASSAAFTAASSSCSSFTFGFWMRRAPPARLCYCRLTLLPPHLALTGSVANSGSSFTSRLGTV